MLAATFSRLSFVIGAALVAVGAYGRREWDTESEMATFGVVALIATGMFAALVGLYSLLRERPARGERATFRQRLLDRAAWRATIPPMVAGGLMLAFFGLTDRWDDLDNPVQSQIALAVGVIGALVAILAERITRWEFVIVPAALIVALVGWGDRLPLDSDSTSRGEMVTLLVIVTLLIGVAINVPQVVRGRRQPQLPA